MTKQKNPNIGHVECLLCNDMAAVRKNRNGLLYYDCLNCGRITPNHRGGQERLVTRAKVWGAEGAPGDCPTWIAEQWPYAVAIRAHKKGVGTVVVKPATLTPVHDGKPIDKPIVLTEDLMAHMKKTKAGPKPPPAPKPRKTPKVPESVPETPAKAAGFSFLKGF